MKFKFKISYLIIFLVLLSILISTIEPVKAVSTVSEKMSSFIQIAGKRIGYTTDEGKSADFLTAAINGLNVLLTFMGVVFLGLLLYAGYLWMTARGNEEQAQKAKKIIREALIGIIIIITARLITEFVVYLLGEAS